MSTDDDSGLYASVAQFYAREAAMLDERRFFDWVDQFVDGAIYQVFSRVRIQARPGRVASNATPALLVDDDKDFLRKRAERLLNTNMAHAERPPSMTRHLITNILLGDETESGRQVEAGFAVFQSRLDTDASTFFGHRLDVLVATDTGFRIAERRVTLDHSVLSRTLTVLF